MYEVIKDWQFHFRVYMICGLMDWDCSALKVRVYCSETGNRNYFYEKNIH